MNQELNLVTSLRILKPKRVGNHEVCVTKPVPYPQSREATLTVISVIVVNTYVGVVIQSCYPKLVACT